MRKRTGAILLAAALMLSGCSSEPPAVKPAGTVGDTGAEKGVTEVIEPVAVEEVVGKDADEKWEAYRLKLDENSISGSFRAGLEQFAYRSASEILQGTEENVNFSPLSLYYALAMAGAGADGKTYEEITDLLGTKEREELVKQSGNIYRYLKYQQGFHEVYQEEYEPGLGEEKKPEILIANSLWADQELTLKEDYVRQLTEEYYASVHKVSFAEDQTWKDMGRWISEKTNGVLEPELAKDGETVLALINTLYYYGSWKDKFPEEATKPDVFTLSDGSQVTADFMNMTVTGYPYREGDGYRAARINTGNNTSMVFVLPDEGRNVSELYATPEKLKEVLNGEYETMKVNWKMPKFSFGSSMKLEDTLQKLGAGDMFQETADFSVMTEEPVLVSSVIQETHIGVDESGVEGAAYTMMALAGCALVEETKVGEMTLDRPFLFGIHSDEAGWLFIGAVEKP